MCYLSYLLYTAYTLYPVYFHSIKRDFVFKKQ